MWSDGLAHSGRVVGFFPLKALLQQNDSLTNVVLQRFSGLIVYNKSVFKMWSADQTLNPDLR